MVSPRDGAGRKSKTRQSKHGRLALSGEEAEDGETVQPITVAERRFYHWLFGLNKVYLHS